ncbi:MAG: glycosyltransferase [Pseudomonadota bacterium]
MAVIIASYNAEATIATAVKSALMQSETLEVYVVDDCSTDNTLEVAKAAGEGDPRLFTIKQPFNQGPSAARNVALKQTTAPFVAVLDSDDAFLPGRFGRIMAQCDWDMCADNLHFTYSHDDLPDAGQLGDSPGRACKIDFETFVLGNLGRRNDNRTELGFLKPVVRRSFLQEHGLAFNDRCRLGEDFILYAHMLALGARFTLIENCGYNALVRANSLSADHAISHLRAFLDASREISRSPHLSAADKAAMDKHIRHLEEKVVHREALEKRKYRGLFPTAWFLLRKPTAIRDIMIDRFGGQPETVMAARALLTRDDFDRLAQ